MTLVSFCEHQGVHYDVGANTPSYSDLDVVHRHLRRTHSIGIGEVRKLRPPVRPGVGGP